MRGQAASHHQQHEVVTLGGESIASIVWKALIGSLADGCGGSENDNDDNCVY